MMLYVPRGLSAGGAMAAVMLATYPEVFVAGAIIAGLAYGAAHSALEAWSAMYWGSYRANSDWGDKVRTAAFHRGKWPSIAVWHGEVDTTVRPGAGDDLVNQWLNVHGLDGYSVERRLSPLRSHHLWRSATGKPLVELHRIAGMAHGTPLSTKGREGLGESGDYLLDVGISSSREIIQSWLLDATHGSIKS
jgi:poly(3-hydroxybutyrate) depolymerase